MSIFAFAMQMEKDGEAYYRKLAEQAPGEGLKRIFTMLADDEVKHYAIFAALDRETPPEMDDTTVMAGARNVFQDIAAAGGDEPNADQVDAYREAQQVEIRSRDLYLEKAAALAEGSARTLLQRIAAEEDKHAKLLGHIIDYVARPAAWIENAEFNHLETY